MELYLAQENVRLVGRFTELSRTNAMLHSQPLPPVTQPVTQPLVLTLPVTQPLPPIPELELEEEEDAFEENSPYQINYGPSLFAANEDTQMTSDLQAHPDSPEFDVSPIQHKEEVKSPVIKLKSNIPIVIPRVVPKRNVNTKVVPKVVPKVNKFEAMNWEQTNEYLHGKYPISKPGVLCINTFDPKLASIDYEELVEINKKGYPDLYLVPTWIDKLRVAIVKTTDSDDF